MKFQHWLPKRDLDDNWTLVAMAHDFEKDGISYDYITISVLVKCDNVEKLISAHDWLEDITFGNQQVWEYNDEILHDFEPFSEKDGMRIEPFVIRRGWYAKETEIQYELVQDFVLFYNLLFDKRESTYKAIKETGEIIDVVKLTCEDKRKKIVIRTDYLRNYLAFKQRFLVRQHDRRIRTAKSMSELGISRFETDYVASGYNFLLVIDNLCPPNNKKSFSMLCGKDVILPLSKRKHLLGWGKKYCKFIIGVNSDGDDIEATCNEDELRRSGLRFSTPVFFKKVVLSKYYDEASKYTVTSTCLSCGNLWDIPIDINPHDLVQVYLGDLGHIPYDEQSHWRDHNTRPSGGISKSRLQRDVVAKFADPEEPMFRFKKSFSVFQKCFSQKYGFDLFMPLTKNDRICETNLRIPLNNEQMELEQQITSIAKILPESINVKLLRDKMTQNGFDSKAFDKLSGSIRKLEFFFKKESIDLDIIEQLDKIQQFRSSAVAHRKGEKFEKVFQKYKLDETSNVEFFKKLIQDLTNSFDKLNSVCS